jgi:hypothetical protein
MVFAVLTQQFVDDIPLKINYVTPRLNKNLTWLMMVLDL